MSDAFVGFLVGWILCTATTMLIGWFFKRQADRIQDRGQYLHDLAKLVVSQHEQAETFGQRDDWTRLGRAIKALRSAVERWEA